MVDARNVADLPDGGVDVRAVDERAKPVRRGVLVPVQHQRLAAGGEAEVLQLRQAVLVQHLSGY